MKKIVLLLTVALCSLSILATAQVTTSKSTVHLRNGQWVTGVITNRDDKTVEIENEADGLKYVFLVDEIDNITHETKKKNYDTSKFRGFIDLGYSLGMGAPRNDYWLVETSFGYEFTPHYYLGLGVGLHNFEAKVGSYPMRYDLTVPEHINPDWKYPFIPVYVEGRYHVKSENGNTPFVSLKLGATFINHAGFFASPTLGYHLASNRVFSFNVGRGYALQTATYKAWCTGETPGAIPDHSGKSYLKKTSLFHNALVKVGVEF